MVERIEDLNLPNTAIQRIIKDVLPEGTNVSKEARCAIARATSVFTIFMTSTSTSLAHEENHKTISPKNVFQALKDQGFESFVDIVQQDLEAYRKMVKDKKDNKSKKDANTSGGSATGDITVIIDDDD